MGKCHAVGFTRKLPLGHRGSTHGKCCRLLAMVSLSRGRSYMEETALPPAGCPSTLSSDIQPAGKGEKFTGSSSTITDKTMKSGFGAEK